MTLAPGSTLAAYAIKRLLGRGGMGEVYLATHVATLWAHVQSRVGA